MIVGLTGGIASGKTLASDTLAKFGCNIVDTDVLAREVVEHGSQGLRQLVEAFGKSILTPDQSLDRPALRKLIFANNELREQVEHIIHPLVYQRMDALLTQPCKAYHVLVSPLLVEKGQYKRCSRVLLIDIPTALQIERVMARDGVDKTQAKQILAAQASRESKLAIANEVIDNSGSIELFKANLANIHQQYLHQQYLELANED